MPRLMQMAGQAAQDAGIAARREAQTPAFDQEALDTRLEGQAGAAHDTLPGHGSATAARLRLSIAKAR